MISGDFDTPIMYQDLANYTMSPMSIPFMPNTSYLGGVQMRPQPDTDKVIIKNKKNEECKNTFKKAMLAIGTIFLLGYVPYFRKNIKAAGGIKNYMSDLWQKFKNLFKTTP